MRLDLAERLQCPRPHAATPLIVVALRVEARELRDGFAGCPVCHLEARVVDGVVRFPPFDVGAAEPRSAPRSSEPAAFRTDASRVERTAALLGLAEPGGAVLLTGRYRALAAPLALAFGVRAVVVEEHDAVAAPGTSVDVVAGIGGAVPFSEHTFRAAALDPPSAAAVRTIAVGGRLLAPVDAARPEGTTQLAQDAEEWLAERAPSTPLVSITRA